MEYWNYVTQWCSSRYRGKKTTSLGSSEEHAIRMAEIYSTSRCSEGVYSFADLEGVPLLSADKVSTQLKSQCGGKLPAGRVLVRKLCMRTPYMRASFYLCMEVSSLRYTFVTYP